MLKKKCRITNRTHHIKPGIASREIPEPVLNFGSLSMQRLAMHRGICSGAGGKGSPCCPGIAPDKW